MRISLIWLMLVMMALTLIMHAALPRVVHIGNVYAHYGSFNIPEHSGELSVPVNNFTLSIPLNSSVPLNATLVFKAGNVSMSREVIINGSTIVNLPVSLPFGSYVASIYVYEGSIALASSNFTLSLVPPSITNISLSTCGVIQSLPATTLYSIGTLNFTVSAVAPLNATIIVSVNSQSQISRFLINDTLQISRVIQLNNYNNTVGIYVVYNGELLASYNSFVIKRTPSITVSYSYGNYTETLANATQVVVSTMHSIHINYAINPQIPGIRSIVTYSNGGEGFTALFSDPGKYLGRVAFMYGSCSIDTIGFSVIAIPPTIKLVPINYTLPVGIASTMDVAISFNQSLIKYVLVRPTGGIGVTVPLINYVLKYPGIMPLNVTPYSIGAGSVSLTYQAVDYGGYTYGPYNSSMIINSTVPSITITGQSITFGEEENLTIHLRFMGRPINSAEIQVLVTKGGEPLISYLGRTNSEGALSLRLMPNSTGIYMVTAKFVSLAPIPIQNTTTFLVQQASPVLHIWINSTHITYGESMLINATLSPASAAGIINLFINNTLFLSRNGTKLSLLFTPPSTGSYIIVAQYLGNTNYSPSITQVVAHVERANCRISLIGVTSIVGSQLNVRGFIKPNITATLEVTVNGSYLDTIRTSGSFSISFMPRLPGNYLINASWQGNPNYNPCYSTEIIKIYKATPIIELKPSLYYGVAGQYMALDVLIRSNVSLPTNAAAILVIKNGNNTIQRALLINNGSIIRLLLNKSMTISLNYLGNEYFGEAQGGPIMINVMPGLMGIPMYSFIVYPLMLLLGILTAIATEKFFLRRRSPSRG